MAASLAAAAAAKPIKTERTHEENQERAYIAASRRSDRSLEARIESARRASEIHKRRTGRSLRVTEQDVINEEMYEEEDDDLPMQYRRLTAHLHTSNAEFDRRLAAYLTNHVAMRAALGQAVGMQNPYPNAAQFASSGMSPFSQQQQSMGPPYPTSANMYGQAGFANPQQTMKSPLHNRSASIANPKELSNFSNPPSLTVAGGDLQDRRYSLPVNTSPNSQDGQPATKRHKSIHSLKLENLPKPMDMLSIPKAEPGSPKCAAPQQSTQSQSVRPSEMPAPFAMSSMYPFGGLGNSMPFSTTLPLESQQLLGGAFDQNDPMTAMFMSAPYQSNQSSYDYDDSKAGNSTFSGMDQTLAPGYLDTDGLDPVTGDKSAFTPMSPFATSAGGYGSNFDDAFRPSMFGNGVTSGEATPSGDREWQSFLNGSVWEEN